MCNISPCEAYFSPPVPLLIMIAQSLKQSQGSFGRTKVTVNFQLNLSTSQLRTAELEQFLLTVCEKKLVLF